MALAQATTSSTPHQRLFARSLMRQAELPALQVTVMHRDLFRQCGIEWVDGERMDPRLESLTREQISSLIDALRQRIGDDDEENDDA